jgi:methionyl-tRNA synthetase
VPVDRPGFEGKVYYVWFDAPIEYIAATWEWAEANGRGDEWRGWWFEADDVRYSQFMAKDNVPFHTVGFPCTIIGSGEPWKLVDYLKAFNWLNYEGGKFSTSEGRGVFMDDALELLPADYWRYYLLRNAPESDDSDFTWEHFAVTVNKDLADTLGNFVNRTLRFTERAFGASVPEGGAPGEAEEALAQAEAALAAIAQAAGGSLYHSLVERIRGFALAQRGDEAGARNAFATSLELARAAGETYELALTLEAIGRLKELGGEDGSAEADEARGLLARLGVVSTADVPLA